MSNNPRTGELTRRPGEGLPPGSRHYRAWVGSPDVYDLLSAGQFNLLISLGLREVHSLLDIGCGSLRAGKLFIPYLLPGHYFGIEPEEWLLEEGIEFECGKDLIKIKRPIFNNDGNFTCTVFGQKFDFILAQSIFTHASQAQIRRCLSQAHLCMKPKSLFVATFIEGEKSYVGNEWVYPENVTYTLSCMKTMAGECGLILEPLEWPYPGQQTWVVMVQQDYEQEMLPNPMSLMEPALVRTELLYYRDRLARLTGHPYVRFGFKMQRVLHRVLRAFRASHA